jgi:hypothetical protein
MMELFLGKSLRNGLRARFAKTMVGEAGVEAMGTIERKRRRDEERDDRMTVY